MSDHRYLCDLYDLEPSRSQDLVDVVLEKDEKALRDEHERLLLDVGRLVHLVWLTPDSPATVVRVEFNKVLGESLKFLGFNQLIGKSQDDPGQWFIDRGYTVRSKKINGYWLQVAFGMGNLVRSEMIEYLQQHTGLDFDKSKVDDGRCQTFGSA